MMRTLLALLALAAAPIAGHAQTPAPATPPAQAAPPAADPLPAPPSGYAYSQDGRRDPFQSLMRGKAAVTAPEGSMRPAGAAGILADELTVRGIVHSNGSYVAMVSGPAAGQHYTVKTGARLFDGTVQSITAREVVILQQVTDPLSLQKQRQVRKVLRGQEEGK
jgi:Tfp pilus assembly protein PilP